MADDLDDDYWEEKDVPVSNDENSDAAGSEREENSDNEQLTVAERLEVTKRKAEDDDEAEKPPKKKKKKRKTFTEKLAEQTPEALQPKDLRAVIEKHYAGKLTATQWDEIRLEDSHFGYCNDLSHTCNSFLNQAVPKWQKRMKNMKEEAGSPLLLLICSSAIRAAQLNRDIVEFKREKCKIAKLFAKHIKLKEQEKFLKKAVIHIGIGTPKRMADLLESGSLKLEQVSHVVLDWSWRDSKLRQLKDVPEITAELLDMSMKYLIPHIKTGKAKIALM